ncbi:MAG: 2-isopropylmalate synthase [Candidatus Nealsonbacteria bacterium]
MEKVIIFDTTLRDGEQAAGGSLNVQEKLEIARQLEKLQVDVIEAGFPVTSPGDFEAVRMIAQKVRLPSICVLTHANFKAIDESWEAVKKAANPRIHIVISSSDIHLFYQLKKSRGEILQMATEAVAHAKKYCANIEFSAMDASRTDKYYVYQLLKAVIDAGATTVNIPDTVGWAMPEQFGKLIEEVFQNVLNLGDTVVSVHCHDDLGLAVANSLAGIKYGARQVEGTINGIGERAGNAALEEIVMAIKTRQDYFGLATGINTTQFYGTSRLVSYLTGFAVQSNKAIIGANAFRHSSGLHVDGMLKNEETFQIIKPSSVGAPSSDMVLGKTSGRHAFRERLIELGYHLNETLLESLFADFKKLADKKKEITDADILSLVIQKQAIVSEIYHLDRLQVSCGDRGIPMAGIRIIGPDGKILEGSALGTGPVDAVYKAINTTLNIPNLLTEFTVKSITEGIDAIGEVLIKIESNGVFYTGRGMDTDIIVASAKAYINALNRFLATKK